MVLSKNNFNYVKIIKSYGDFNKVYDLDRTIDSIINIFSTPRGTYPDDPNFGTIIQKFCFDPLDEITKQNIEEEVKEVIYNQDFNVRIISVDVAFFSDKKGFIVEINLFYNNEKKNVKLEAYDGKIRSLI